MGAGSSTEQRSPEQTPAGSATLAEPEPSGGSPSAEAAPDPAADPAIAAADPAAKLLQKNGQLSTANGLAEQGELSLQEGAPDGQEEVIVPEVGQRESEDVNERDPDKEMTSSTAVEDMAKDVQEEMPEIIEQIPSSESNLEELTQPPESQASDVGFKKVFKFVGFKFTVKKDKTEKSDAVQLLTVKKDEGEEAGGSNGAGDHQEPSWDSGEAAPKEGELKQPVEKPEETPRPEQSSTETPPQAESGPVAEGGKEEGEEKPEKEPSKPAESPTSPMTSETASPFKKFFTQGWAGWRKKTSFRKPKEDELEASEKKKESEPEKGDTEDKEKTEDTCEKLTASEQPGPQEPLESSQEARLSADYEKVELPSEDPGDDLQGPSEEKSAPLATEVFDESVDVHQEVVAEVHVDTSEQKTGEQKAEEEEAGSLPPEKFVETEAELQEAEPAEELGKTREVCAPGGDHLQQAELSPDDKALSKHPDGVVTEVEILSSQERIKVQGSPLKKLFSSTGLKKLSGKKHKRRGGGDEESGEHNQVPAESPDSTDEQKGDSSASSPEEPEEITCLERGITEAPQDAEAEEGATSDGEKRREGVTPWASFKKMVTPKKRVRRPSESDKEDEVDKVKSATLSSTESAASEMPEETKRQGDEPKPEEPKRRVDTSVSWEALICVGSSKKRARKASSSDEEGGPKTAGDSQKADDAAKDRDAGTDATLPSSQEHDQGQGSSSPEQAGSPSEGEGVSTWESFKRLVTARKKSKSKMEEKNEDSVAGSGLEHSASDAEPGREESWVSIKKFIPGRRKKRADGKQEQTTVEETGPTEVNEDDSDVPAVVPLSEYDAVEREKMEAQQAQEGVEKPEQKVAVYVSEELSKTLVHTVAVAVVDGTRAVTSIEERSPSWISASVTGPLELAEDETRPLTGKVVVGETIAEEPLLVTKTLPESRDARGDVVVSEGGLPAAISTAAETTGAFGPEEVTEASGAEETTEMVSAVSQLTDSPNTTEEATPVQEVEDGVPDTEDRERRTQEVLQAVAEKVKESQLLDTRGPEDTVQTTRKGESETEEDSGALDPKKEMGVMLMVQGQETQAEDLTPGATPESSDKAPQVTETLESSELVPTCPAEPLAEAKLQEIVVEQAIPPDSAETLMDSETNGSTRVAESEPLGTTQHDKIMDIHEDSDVAPDTQSRDTEAEEVPAQEERAPAPSGFPSQEENQEQSKAEEILEHTDSELSVDPVPILSKAELTQEAGRCADEDTQDGPSAGGPEVPVDTVAVSQEKVSEVVLKDEATEEAECQKNDSIEHQSRRPSTPVVGEVGVEVEREKVEAKPTPVSEEKVERKPAVTVSEESSKELVQTLRVATIDGEKEVHSFEGSLPQCLEEAACTGIQIQSSEESFALTAAAVEEKVLGETVRILETGETLQLAGAHLVLEEKSSEKDEDVTAWAGEDAASTRPESQAESTPPVALCTPEKGPGCHLEGEKTTSQKQKTEEIDEEVVCQEVNVSVTREEALKAECEILELETKSNKLVQNIIQTAVDQFVRTEETAPETFPSTAQAQAQAQVPLMNSDSQGARQKMDKEGCAGQAPAQDGTWSVPGREQSELPTLGQIQADVSKEASEASEQLMTDELESSSVNDKQLEEAVLPSKAEGGRSGTEAVSEDDSRTMLGEMAEKPLCESKEDKNDEALDDPEIPSSALADPDASGGLTKESPDANGPKLTEEDAPQEVELQEGKVYSESEDGETRAHAQEETQKPERESATAELAES